MIDPSANTPQERFTGILPPTIESAATIAPSSILSFVSGTVSIETIVPLTSGPHQITLIFTAGSPAAFLTSGNIALAVTPTQYSSTLLQFEPRTAKYYPIIVGVGTLPTPPGGDPFQLQFNSGGTFSGIDNGSGGQVLTSNGSDEAPSFQAPPSSTPGGNNKQIQYNNNSAFGGISPDTAGKVLTSNGVSDTPSFQSLPANTPGGTAFQTQYNNSGAMGGVGPGSSGQVLTSAGAGVAPSYQNLPTSIGGLDKQIQYNNAGVLGGISPGTAGLVLTSNGVSVNPSFQAVTASAAGSSFATQYNSSGILAGAGPGTSGHVLTSNGASLAPSYQAVTATPAGSANQLQYNNSGVLGGVTNGTAGQVLTANGTSSLPSFQAAPAGNPAGSDKQLQVNNAGAFGALSNGTAGHVLVSNGAGSFPSFQVNTASAGGSDHQIQFNNGGVLDGISPSTLGYVLTSNGISADPTFQPASISGMTAVWYNVKDFGALGNANSTAGGGQDDTTFIQDAIDAAMAGGYGAVVFPKGTYRITSTLVMSGNVYLLGIGGRDNAPIAPPIILWDGANNGLMVSITTVSVNTTLARIENLAFYGGNEIVNKPGTCLRYEGDGLSSPVDTGTVIIDCWFYNTTGNAIEMLNGATNFYLWGGRWDETSGYAIYITGTSMCQLGGAITWASSNSDGFMFLDGESDSSRFIMQIDSLHTELQTTLNETFASGTNPFDRRGIIRCGVSPALNFIQHRLSINNWQHNFASGVPSHSMVQITATSGTVAQASEGVTLILNQGDNLSSGSTDGSSTDQIRLLGGMVPSSSRYPFSSSRTGNVNWGKGKDFTAEGNRSFTYSRHGSTVLRGVGLQAEVVADLDLFPVGNASGLAYVTNATSTTRYSVVAGGGSNKVIVFWNGTNWLIL